MHIEDCGDEGSDAVSVNLENLILLSDLRLIDYFADVLNISFSSLKLFHRDHEGSILFIAFLGLLRLPPNRSDRCL